jgi:hypothetical protein
MQDQNNNKITLNSDGITIESTKDLIMKAANNVSIKGIKVEAEGSSEFAAKGNTKAGLQSSGQTEIKGGTVMIN